MSRIGKKIITTTPTTHVSLADGIVSVKGPLGELSRPLTPGLSLSVSDNTITITPEKDDPQMSALWGTFASHVTNMVNGVGKAFEKKLLIEGIGYKVELKGTDLVFALGFSHPITIPIPNGIKVTVEKNVITVSGIDKEQVGGFAARLRDLKKPEPYKGKGIRYEDEVVKIKQGKKTA